MITVGWRQTRPNLVLRWRGPTRITSALEIPPSIPSNIAVITGPRGPKGDKGDPGDVGTLPSEFDGGNF